MRENVLPKDAHSNKYGYEIANGFLEGNIRYPVLNYSDSIYKFDHTLNQKNNNVVVLDVESIVYHDGFIYANVLDLNRWIAYGSDDKTSDWKLIETCTPLLYRFMILSNENATKGNYTPLNHADLQNIHQLNDVAIMYEEANLVRNSLSSDSTWRNIQGDIKEWYNPSLFGKETFRNKENLSCLHVPFNKSIVVLEEMWSPISLIFPNDMRDIFLFAIHKVMNDNQ